MSLWVRLWLGFVLVAALTLGVLAGCAFLLDAVLPPGEQGPLVLGGVLLVGGAVSVLVAALLARQLARPLSLVSQVARRVAGGDLSARVQARPREMRGRDEAAQLLINFDAMAESLERLEGERQASAATIAHELRTPLTILKGRLEALRDGVLKVTPEELALLLAQTDLLTYLVEDLRVLSLADAGRLVLERGEVDLSRLVRELTESVALKAAGRLVELTCEVREGLRVQGDEQRLRQVIANLLDNALKFSPTSGQVVVALFQDAERVTLRVRDSGPGVRSEALAHLFDRFYRDDDMSKGSGLGLAVVKSLVELHGGRVAARNHPQGGAEFEVVLPRL